MAENITKNDLSKLESKLEVRFDDLTALMSQFANDVNDRFDKVDARFEGIEQRLDKLEDSHQRLLNTVDGFVGRIDRYEIELAARDHKIDRLERWIQQLAANSKIELT
jgi:DNA anti-recombination protein RmuC